MSRPRSDRPASSAAGKMNGTRWLAVVLLVLVTIGLYAPVRFHDYVAYDDGDYVYENKMVQQGITGASVTWAFTQSHAANWHPLTWLSHMLDWQLFGNKAGGHHFTNVLLHAANALLVLWALRRLTGAFWRSLFVAALFAFHPLHVESVAWLAERKDVLCAFFGLLTLVAYAGYAQRRNTGGFGPAAGWYAATLGLFACGLMSKPMLVTWPFVLLLVDVWPLRRLPWLASEETPSVPPRPWLPVMLEKIPFFLLSFLSSYVTFEVQKGKTVQSLAAFSVPDRIANTLVSYGQYLWKTFWPESLAFFYPLLKAPALGLAAAMFGLLLTITAVIFIFRHAQPWNVTGWLWFLGTLVPVIGLVHVGEQSHADRYTYLPSIGLFLALVWTMAAVLEKRPALRPVGIGVAVIALVACLILTNRQIPYWKNNEAMLQRALAVTQNNFLAHNNYGVALADKGHYAEALPHYEQAIGFKPTYQRAYDNAGAALTMLGRYDDAAAQFQRAFQLSPNIARTHHNYALLLGRQGKFEEVITECQRTLELDPNYTLAYYDMGAAYYMLKRYPEALAALEKAVAADPKDTLALNLLAKLRRQPGMATP